VGFWCHGFGRRPSRAFVGLTPSRTACRTFPYADARVLRARPYADARVLRASGKAVAPVHVGKAVAPLSRRISGHRRRRGCPPGRPVRPDRRSKRAVPARGERIAPSSRASCGALPSSQAVEASFLTVRIRTISGRPVSAS
jgi:hypothetical protein